jgi:carboxyl-terminal processing protease
MRVYSIGVVLLLTSRLGFAQIETQRCSHANNLIQLIEQKHIQPLPLSDEWSERVFNNLFIELDPLNLYFIQEDLDQFTAQEHQLDDLVKSNKHCAWLSTVSQLLKKRTSDYKTWLEQSLGKPFDYTVAEKFDVVNFPPEEVAESAQQLDTQRKSYLKFQILMRMYLESVADSSGKPILTYESLARKNIKAKELKKIADLEERSFENHTSTSFLKAIALAYDPHTTYMSASENDDFNALLSDQNFSFGFSLDENEAGSFLVKDIIPGGPAWNSNAVREGDILLSVELPDKRMLNAMDYELEDLLELIESASVEEVWFTLKKAGGQLTKIKLVKEKVRSIENTVSGYVLKGTKKIGYIPLPSFYFDWKKESSGGCANDVAKAIIKLNKENIDGLILDLRFNGGGSIDEARDLAGIFIDFGPVIMYKQSGQPVLVLKDSNKGTIYNGPLIIMINGFSASASELLASSLQDHKRALIVGGRTYGKGTGQDIFRMPGGSKDFAKVTLLKIYRINGRTFQHKGVIPDVPLPDITQHLGDRETDYPYALSSDSVTKKAYYAPAVMPALTSLLEKSKARVDASEAFSGVNKLQVSIQQPIPLDEVGFKNFFGKPRVSAHNGNSQLTVSNTTFDASLLAMDAFRKALNEKSVKEIRESFYIQEAYEIMLDYISLKK